MRHLFIASITLLLLPACKPIQASADPTQMVATCPVTPWSQALPTDTQVANYTSTWYVQGELWAGLAPAYHGIWQAGSQGVEVLWLGVARHTLSISGLELDRPSGHLESRVSPDSPAFGGLITSLVFPYVGCWTVIGGTDHQILVFTVDAQPPSTAQSVQP
jgi:hypothetical protein